MSDKPMSGKIVVVTGANTGIGRATAENLAGQGATVVMICRSRERGEEARKAIISATGNQNVELVLADLGVMADVRKAAAEIKGKHPAINVLVNNAAVFLRNREVTPDGFEKTFATNYLSHFLLTNLLIDQLKAGKARIVNVATLTRGLSIDLDDLQLEKKKYSFMAAVGPTKLALILFTRELAKRLEGTGVTVNALHPGLVKTPLLDEIPAAARVLFHLFSTTPEKGAQTSIYLASSPEVEGVTGKLWAKKKEQKLGGQAADPDLALKLWDISAKLAGIDANGALRRAS